MTKEEYRAHTKFELVKINKRLYKNVCRLIRQKIELKEQIADIKANCDLAIEGRDIKIKELEKENTELKKEIEKHKWNDIFLEDCAGYDKKIAEEYTTLQERIEKLEQENERLRGDLELWESGGCRATNLFECGVVKELKERYDKVDIIGYDALKNLTKAIGIIKRWYETNRSACIEPSQELIEVTEQFLNNDGCPDVMCEDCTKEDCTVRKLGLVSTKEIEK